MRRIVAVALFLVSLALVQSGEAQDKKSLKRSATIPAAASSRVQLTYLGTAGWEVTNGEVVVLVDPYLSRLRIIPPANFGLQPDSNDRRPAVGQNDLLITDTATVDKHILRADFILITHSHLDHIMDAPYIAQKTRATVVGHQSSINVMRSYGISDDKLITVRGGEDYEFGKFSLKVVPSLHSSLFQKHFFDERVIPSTVKPPFKIADLREGGSLAYLIRIGGHQILTFGSMNYVEREIQGLRPDVVIMGAGASRAEIYDYAGRLMRALGFPALVLPTHWDNYFLPFEASQGEYIRTLQPFTKEVNAASLRTRVIVPKYFEPIEIPPAKK
jgi:L-ascorbate metabolism protein UlaG (beta-lactamase superfamily)